MVESRRTAESGKVICEISAIQLAPKYVAAYSQAGVGFTLQLGRFEDEFCEAQGQR